MAWDPLVFCFLGWVYPEACALASYSFSHSFYTAICDMARICGVCCSITCQRSVALIVTAAEHADESFISSWNMFNFRRGLLICRGKNMCVFRHQTAMMQAVTGNVQASMSGTVCTAYANGQMCTKTPIVVMFLILSRLGTDRDNTSIAHACWDVTSCPNLFCPLLMMIYSRSYKEHKTKSSSEGSLKV